MQSGTTWTMPAARPAADPAARLAWTQVVLASLLMLATLPGRTQGLGLITEPLLADLHLDRITYANMNLWATLLGALFCFPAGWAIDRFGLRWVTATIVLLLGLTVWRVSAVSAAMLLLFGLLLATRALGQSALSVCSITTVGRWFPNRAGFAMGVYSVLLSVFFAAAFGVIGYSVRTNGWRTAWFQIAVGLCVVIAPLVMLALREPERRITTGEIGDKSSPKNQATLTEALRSSAFWIFAGSAGAFNLVSSGLGLFNEAVLKERGFDQATFHLFLAVTTLMSLGGQFLCGWLTRRWTYQRLTFLALMLYGISLAGIPLLTRHWQLWIIAVLVGAAGGMIIVIFFSVWSDLFGQRHLGRIQGAAQMLTVLSSGLGPVLFASCVTLSGSYSPLLFAMAFVSVLLALIVVMVRNPRSDFAC
jgi:MFS family permease